MQKIWVTLGSIGILWIVTIVLLAVLWAVKKIRNKPTQKPPLPPPRDYAPFFGAEDEWVKPFDEYQNGKEGPFAEKTEFSIQGVYQKKWLFSYNEKNAYYALKQIADKNNLYIMAKVRLLDLLEPKKGIEKYRTYFYKVQAKHVDFVICDQKLVARCVIELDDGSHKREDRQARDAFVDDVLHDVGYEIIHVKGIDVAAIESRILKACCPEA